MNEASLCNESHAEAKRGLLRLTVTPIHFSITYNSPPPAVKNSLSFDICFKNTNLNKNGFLSGRIDLVGQLSDETAAFTSWRANDPAVN